MIQQLKNQSWKPAIASAVAAIGVVYLGMYSPERARRLAIEQEILSAARNMHADSCRHEMVAEGIDQSSFKDAGGYIKYIKLADGLSMTLNATFVDERRNYVLCSISLAPATNVSIWQPE